MLKCIDVEQRFPACKIGYEDDSFVATRDPWHKVIECRGGHVSPAGGDMLWACTKTRTTKAAKMMLANELPCRIVMDGDDGINAEFNVNDADMFLKVMGAKLR